MMPPSWFKLSFLDITEDAQEAYDSNKHLMVFGFRWLSILCENVR